MTTTTDTASIELPQLLDDIIIHENDLSEKAKQYFSYHTAVFHAYEKFRRNILGNDCLTSVGRHLLLSNIDKWHTEFKRVLNYAAQNVELLSGNMPAVGPLIICGLPRSGTTLLYNLLSCDPNCRAPLLIDMAGQCVPPIARSNVVEQERRLVAVELARQQREKVTGRPNQIVAAHPNYAVEEDVLILQQASSDLVLALVTFDDRSEPDACLNDFITKTFMYDYHETFLRMLNSVDAPHSHWLLKVPRHALFLDTILRHYPHALLIFVHRHPDETLPSYCSMVLRMVKDLFDEADSTSLGRLKKRTIQYLDKMVEHIVEFHIRRCHDSNQSQTKMFDVTYYDLMKEPIGTVRRIYDHYNLHWSDEFEVAMRTWLCDNPQGKQGRHTYNLSDIGLTHEDIEARYADYINLFLRSPAVETTGIAVVGDK